MISYVCCIIVIIVALIGYCIFQKDYNERVEILHRKYSFTGVPGIPKIIHQQGPKDISKWHPNWVESQQTWLAIFPQPEYTHILWNDDSIRDMISTYYPQYLKRYDAVPKNIIKYDIARLFMLHLYGGIYVDLDYEVFKNFQSMLPPNSISIVESPYKENENLQNSLMASPRGHEFWIAVVEDIFRDKNMLRRMCILSAAGPKRIDRNVKHRNDINILPHYTFNPYQIYSPIDERVRPNIYKNDPKYIGFDNKAKLIARHNNTTTWGAIKGKSMKSQLEL